jgi:hypothetical protein
LCFRLTRKCAVAAAEPQRRFEDQRFSHKHSEDDGHARGSAERPAVIVAALSAVADVSAKVNGVRDFPDGLEAALTALGAECAAVGGRPGRRSSEFGREVGRTAERSRSDRGHRGSGDGRASRFCRPRVHGRFGHPRFWRIGKCAPVCGRAGRHRRLFAVLAPFHPAVSWRAVISVPPRARSCASVPGFRNATSPAAGAPPSSRFGAAIRGRCAFGAAGRVHCRHFPRGRHSAVPGLGRARPRCQRRCASARAGESAVEVESARRVSAFPRLK